MSLHGYPESALYSHQSAPVSLEWFAKHCWMSFKRKTSMRPPDHEERRQQGGRTTILVRMNDKKNNQLQEIIYCWNINSKARIYECCNWMG